MIKIAIFSAIINLVDYDLPFLILSTKRFGVHMDQEMSHKRKLKISYCFSELSKVTP